jgi:hypothetical protein
MILSQKNPTFGTHSYQEYEELYDPWEGIEPLDIPDHETGIGAFGAFLLICCLALVACGIAILVLW